MQSTTSSAAQVAALMLISLVAGSLFGIWRGYEAIQYTPSTFLEVHQGAVRGLNTLLPAMAIASLVLVLLLAFLNRARPGPLWLYLLTAVAIAAGGVITRFINQPINEQVMSWTATTLPADWTSLRDTWWNWHRMRLVTTVAAELLLIAAIFQDRNSSPAR